MLKIFHAPGTRSVRPLGLYRVLRAKDEDIMMGYSLALIERLLGADYPSTSGYLARLKSRDAYQRVLTHSGNQ